MGGGDFDNLLAINVPHIHEEIFFSLDFQSFKNCHLVCKTWNHVLSAESFHQKAKKLLAVNNQKLWWASTEGNANKVARILSNGMVDVNNEVAVPKMPWTTTTPLKWASYNGFKDVVQLLLKAGADANKTVEGGPTPLLHSVRHGLLEVVQILLDGGANPNIADREGYTPLYEAIVYFPFDCSMEIIKLLLENGANVDHEIKFRWHEFRCTPLLRAVSYGKEEVVQILLENGADPIKKLKNYRTTPLAYAHFQLSMLPHEPYENIIKMLEDAKLNTP